MRALRVAVLAGLLLGPASASVMIVNPGFDLGLTGWDTSGPVGDFSVETGTSGPAGDPKLVLTSSPGTIAALGSGAVPADPDVIALLLGAGLLGLALAGRTRSDG